MHFLVCSMLFPHCSGHFECCFGSNFQSVFVCACVMPRRTKKKIRSVSDVCSRARASKATVVRSQHQWTNHASSMQSSTSAHTTWVRPHPATYLPWNFCPSRTITSALSHSYLLSRSIYTSFQLHLMLPVIKSHSAQTLLAQAKILNRNVELRNSASHGF